LEGKEGIGLSFLSHDKPKTETAKTIGAAKKEAPVRASEGVSLKTRLPTAMTIMGKQ
jgi:hypothetical protein